MAIPSLPTFFDMVYTKQDGHLAADGYLYNDQMFRVLNVLVVLVNSLSTSAIDDKQNVTLNGLNPPSKTTAEITALQPSVNNGTLFYNSTLKKLQFKADTGVIETITST
jgi:hypothetical protein